jgi:hypothetical protein
VAEKLLRGGGGKSHGIVIKLSNADMGDSLEKEGLEVILQLSSLMIQFQLFPMLILKHESVCD